MAEDWLADVRRYHAGADEGVVRKITNYLGIALRNRDSSLVSFSDPSEVDRVRERYLRKKLALTAPDAELDRGLDAVKQMMSADRTKNRVTAYYLLADYFGKHDLFGGAASAPGGFSFSGAGAAAAAGVGVAAGKPVKLAKPVKVAKPVAVKAVPVKAAPVKAVPVKAVPVKPAVVKPVAVKRVAVKPVAVKAAVVNPVAVKRVAVNPVAVNAAVVNPRAVKPAPVVVAPLVGSTEGESRVGAGGIGKWLLLAAAIVLAFVLLKNCTGQKDVAPVAAAPVETTANAAAAPVAEAAIPSGSGVVAGMKDEKPMATVYFDSGKSAVSNDLAAAAATLKAYLDGHPGAKLAVSGYNDPSGNAAANAELSKNRAQGVAAALKAAGIADTSVELVKPAEATSAGVTPEQARRVEVTVQ